MLRVVSLPFCQVVMLDEWDAPPSRFFAAYRATGSSRWVLGHPVVDEFSTISSPIFLTPRALLGKIYNVGITLGHRRDAEMALDLGWPPLCVGVDSPAPHLPADWEEQLLREVQTPIECTVSAKPLGTVTSFRSRTHQFECYRWADAAVVASSEPLLPRQLTRLCEAIGAPLTIAVGVGNRIERSREGKPGGVQAVSETKLEDIVQAAARLSRVRPIND
jgi:hypothetical protein